MFRCKAKIPNPTPDNYAPTVVYCDIYLNGTYYKTLNRTAFISDDGIAPEYEFDIQDAVQEVMSYSLPTMDGNQIEDHTDNLKTVFVKFRNAYLDANGFNVSEQTAPVQGTSSSAPVPGAGTQSNSLFVLYAVIQHEENQDFKTLLNSYKTGSWDENTFPLTKRPEDFKMCKKDSSHFPILTDKTANKLCIKLKTFFGEEIELCSVLNHICPLITNISYSVVDNSNGTQTFTFNWLNPADMSMISSLDIYYQEVGQSIWQTDSGSYTPTRSVTVPLGKYNFRFGFVGSCDMGDILNLPGISDIGIVSNQGGDKHIFWKNATIGDNHLYTTQVKFKIVINGVTIIDTTANDPSGFTYIDPIENWDKIPINAGDNVEFTTVIQNGTNLTIGVMQTYSTTGDTGIINATPPTAQNIVMLNSQQIGPNNGTMRTFNFTVAQGLNYALVTNWFQ
ncbi:hypothetical protein [Chryseobacterium gambrini]|uniref:hypothetical protein n=1 Tax=Chryseobacterium gambrini TaxID=373672 RepID=UPI00111558BF|nr:hypothetical protein [Chryseobacterium gambrini]